MWWLAIGGYYVAAMGSFLFNVSFLSYFLNLTPSVYGFTELPVKLYKYIYIIINYIYTVCLVV